VAALAQNLGRDGLPTLLVDLSAGSFLARLLGVPQPGPAPAPVAALGPMVGLLVPPDDPLPALFGRADDRSGASPPPLAPQRVADGAVVVLVDVDPTVTTGAIRTWAGSGVAVVTAGATGAARTTADAELVRAAGVALRSAVLVAADHHDDSPGALAGAGGTTADPRVGWPVRLHGGARP